MCLIKRLVIPETDVLAAEKGDGLNPCRLVLNNVLGSVIGREEYSRYDITGFLITDIISAMRALSSSPFVEELVDEIMEMS